MTKVISTEQFEPEHLVMLELPEIQHNRCVEMVKSGEAVSMRVMDRSWSIFIDDKPVVCIGLIPQWKGRLLAWAYMADIPLDCVGQIVKGFDNEMRKVFDHGVHRIEATVPVSFGRGCTLMYALRFKVEGQLAKYGPDGEDHFMFARTV